MEHLANSVATRDKHKAPTYRLIHPLSLQNFSTKVIVYCHSERSEESRCRRMRFFAALRMTARIVAAYIHQDGAEPS